MDYYEELGLERSASPEKIRQAYKHLVRILHPDHCTDEAGRRLAEIQTKRLNGILEVLTNPVHRREYDRSIAMAHSRHARHTTVRRIWAPVVAGLLIFIILAGLNRTADPKASAITTSPAQTVAARPKPLKPVRTRSQPREARTEPPAVAALPVPPLEKQSAEVLPPEPAPAAPIDIPELLLPEPEFPSAPNPGLEGDWFFVPSQQTRRPGLYPPEYIELRMSAASGRLRGRYRARYRVPDQAISPSVSFQFEGPAGADGVRLPWHGMGGATGQVNLHLLSNGSLEVSWTANHMGEELGLISGTATLVRKLN